MKVRAVVVSFLLAGCTGGSAAVLSNDQGGTTHQLTGAWDVMLSLNRPYALELRDPPARRLCGMIGFVDGEAQRDAHVRESAGVYHLDLTRLGLDWLADAKFPAAIGRVSNTENNALSVDSVTITLNPDSQEHIVLRGLFRVPGVAGNWTAQSPRGTASGAFTLRPHSSGGEILTC